MEAMLQADADTPNKKTLLEHLKSAKELVSNVDDLVFACAGAITTVAALF